MTVSGMPVRKRLKGCIIGAHRDMSYGSFRWRTLGVEAGTGGYIGAKIIQ